MYICEYKDPELRFSVKENVFITLMTVIFLACGYRFDALLGGAIYCILLLLFVMIFLNDILSYIFTVAYDGFKRIVGRF